MNELCAKKIVAGLLPLAWLAFGACGASGTPAPDVAVPAVSVEVTESEADVDPASETPEADAAAAVETTPDSAADIEDRLVALAYATRGPTPTLPPIKPFGVSWSPEPKEGSAFSVRIYERPTGRKPVAIEGEFAGRTVRFARTGPRGRWLGIAVVPIGWEDPGTMALRMRFEDGGVFEQTVQVGVEPTRFPSSNLSVAPRFSSPPPEVLERIRRESAMVRSMLNTVTPEWLLDGPFQPPRPMDVTSPFGQARMFNGELQSRHTGLDLRGTTGTPVRSAGRGRVAFAGPLYFAGNAVYVDHGLGVYSGYFHLSRILVSEGDEVATGDQVGETGATGRVTAAHLHWYLSVDGVAADASSLLGMNLQN